MNKRESSSQEVEVRKGPWTMEEDMILVNYIATHGEGVWNSLAQAAGLKRTGKSCRLRWLNYLKPDVRRGNITPEEQLLIMELHAKWGNRWSKIAKHLPGRTDNEIKNFWRTRIQKQLKQQEADHQQNVSSSQSSSHHEIASSMNQMPASVSTTTPDYYHQVAQDIYSPPTYPETFMDGFPDTATTLLPPAPMPMPSNETQDVQVWNMEDLWSA